jgi:hypothetical protein
LASLPHVIESIVFGFLFSLAAIISFRLLTGEINTSGVLRTKSPSGDNELSPARVQLLLFTLATAGTYLSEVLAALGSGKLPDVPETLLAVLGGSNVFYLGTKAYAFFAQKHLQALGGPGR